MAAIRSKDTKPEKLIRSALHKTGLRFRLHRRDLPGNPDIVLPKYKVAIFVHGCFWHQHQGCRDGKVPEGNSSYWIPKLKRNVVRDKQSLRNLQHAGWKTIVVWECEVKKNLDTLMQTLLKNISAYCTGSKR